MAVDGWLDAADRQVRVRALGPITLVGPEGGSGAEVPLGTSRAARLLAALLVRGGSVVGADALVEVVWDEKRPRHAEAALQTVVSRLRSQLRAVGLVDVLVTRGPGYALRLAEGQSDVSSFRALGAEGKSLLGADPARAARLLDQALALWRGAAFGELADEEFAATEIGVLDELRTAATEDRAEAALLMGEAAEAVSVLERVVVSAPLRERPIGRLMVALCRAGRQREALAVYREYRDRLGEQLGLRPSAEIRALAARVANPDPAPPVPKPRHRGAPVAPGRLVVPATSLVGRARELDALGRGLREHAVITLTGPGGVGKTRLALAAVNQAGRQEHADGAWLVELASLEPSSSAAAAVLAALGAPPAGANDPVGAVVEVLRARRALLVLDSCEHVIDDVATLVHEVSRSCPGVTVLATSRTPLGVESEWITPVPPLAVERPDPDAGRADAVALFIERATAATPAFDPSGATLAAVEELCRRLDGMPLAIELAAGRMRSMTPNEVLACLPSTFRFLRNPYRLATERHRTLQAVIDWSYRLLEPEDRRLFERFSVFAGGFTAEDAAAVAGCDPLTAADRLSGLVNRSMVTATPGPDSVSTRYSLLETLRVFGLHRLAEGGDAPAAFRAHAEHQLALLRGHVAGASTTLPDQRVDDIRSACRWALANDPALAAGFAAAFTEWASRWGACAVGPEELVPEEMARLVADRRVWVGLPSRACRTYPPRPCAVARTA